MNEIRRYLVSITESINTHHFSSSSPPTLICSPVWHYDWSDRLSIKLPEKGQLSVQKHYITVTIMYTLLKYIIFKVYIFLKNMLKQVFLTLALEVHFAGKFNPNLDQTSSNLEDLDQLNQVFLIRVEAKLCREVDLEPGLRNSEWSVLFPKVRLESTIDLYFSQGSKMSCKNLNSLFPQNTFYQIFCTVFL